MFKDLELKKMNFMLLKGIKNKDITPFDEDFYSKLNNTFINCVPVSFYIKYLNPSSKIKSSLGTGKCIDRSLFMFLCFDDAVLVRADVKDLELKYGKDSAIHGWIEIGDYVYDPSTLFKYKKDIYYKIYKPSNIKKITVDEYKKENLNFYREIKNVSIKDFKKGGKRRRELLVSIPLIEGIANLSDSEEFKKDIKYYLREIEYNEKDIQGLFPNISDELNYFECNINNNSTRRK